MPEAARIGDPFATGHPCDGGSKIAQGDATFRLSGRPAARVGDLSQTHDVLSGDMCVPHVVPIAAGSATFFVNGAAQGRVGDSIDAGAITGGDGTFRVG